MSSGITRSQEGLLFGLDPDWYLGKSIGVAPHTTLDEINTGAYPRRAEMTWASATAPGDLVEEVEGLTLTLSASDLAGVTEDARLEPNPDWRVGWGERSAGWEIPTVGDRIELARRLRTGRRQYGRSRIGRALIATNPHQKTYWFILVGSRNEPYHHGGHSTRFEIALKNAEQFILRFDLGHNRQWAILVLANNKTQVRRWAERLAAPREKERDMRDMYEIMGTSQAEVLRQQAALEVDRGTERAAALLAKAAFLESLPPEPQVEDGEPNVVYFEKQFDPGGTVYNYSATKSNGYWFTTGPSGGNVQQTWADLVKWIYTYRSGQVREDAQIWWASEFSPL